MAMTDRIYEMIRELIESDGAAEIGRNELAGKLGCVPSQINYVISSRFTPEQGYIVESRRGGGGYIRIRMVDGSRDGYRMHIVNNIGTYIDMNSALAILRNLVANGCVPEHEGKLILAALRARSVASLPPETAGAIRADLLKNMLLNI
ncbi:MAG: CtsR family transcriptional regulator [Clostridia bacterium]|nr:CtsR family transcriptional regulator [Clostridia bacterium]MBR5768911.1 CtsR family transcriptional regulator [Clostridia bacterium]